MSLPSIQVRELAAWDLDAYPYRPRGIWASESAAARHRIRQRPDQSSDSALVDPYPEEVERRLRILAARADLQVEMAGLNWSVGVVDLHRLLAFQRRLSLGASRETLPAPCDEDWDGLLDLCFGAPRQLSCSRTHIAAEPGSLRTEMVVTSSDPNLQIRTSNDCSTPFLLHTGSPFFEVAEYRGRWFLRDGYHRAYRLLRSGVRRVPTVIVQARTLEELGATRPWFFREQILLSPNPPRVADFLDDALVLQYDRPPLVKTLRVTIEESLEPVSPSGDPS